MDWISNERRDDFIKQQRTFSEDNNYIGSSFFRNQKSELKIALESDVSSSFIYNILWSEQKKRIEKKFKNAKRCIFYHDVAKRVPVLRNKIIDGRIIDEFWPMLPILEEKQVDNPSDKNIKVHNIDINTNVIQQEKKYVQEALPPEPLECIVYIPYSLYILPFIEQNDILFDSGRYLQHLKILFDSIKEIENQIGEKISIFIECQDNDNIEDSKQLWKEEKEERSKIIFARIKRNYDWHDLHVWLDNHKLDDNIDRPVISFSLDPGENENRFNNVLVNILRKDSQYLETQKRNHVEMWWHMQNTVSTINDVIDDYIESKFVL
jgi:hypothetical protein